MGKKTGSPRLFNGISWGVTILIVVSLLGFGFWRIYPSLSVSAAQASQEATPTGKNAPADFATAIAPTTSSATPDAIVRQVWLKTAITSKTTYTVTNYTVQPGDALFSIAAQFNIKPETLMWANDDILNGSPDSLRIGQVFKVPPVDGVYYQVQTGDTLASIAKKFSANLDDILARDLSEAALSGRPPIISFLAMISGQAIPASILRPAWASRFGPLRLARSPLPRAAGMVAMETWS